VLEGLDPEPARARALVERRGATPKTWRFLAAKGFAAETIETLVADGDDGAVE
jgi:SOS response regulatory protein OraA/RecX